MRIMTWITACVLLFLIVAISPVCADTSVNSLKEVSVQTEGDLSVVHIVTEQSVGYRYTVYDSNDPNRVVIDFPRMNLGELQTPIKIDQSPLQEIRLSTFDLSLGSLARVELLLDKDSEYKVNFSGKDMQITFAAAVEPAAVESAAVEPAAVESAAVEPVAVEPVAVEPVAVEPVAVEPVAVEPVAVEPVAVALNKVSVTVGDRKVLLSAKDGIDKVRYFTLETPKRLVVDLYGVEPSDRKNYQLGAGFDRMRVGPYDAKTRFVFDVSDESFPQFTVNDKDNAVIISWAEETKAETQKQTQSSTAAVNVNNIDFSKEGTSSKLVIELDSPVKAVPLVTTGPQIQFSLPDTTISRSLRRVFDTLAFPSAIHSVTPYLVAVGDGTEVRFSVQLKGEVKTSLTSEGNAVILTVDDGVFAEKKPLDGEVFLVPVNQEENKGEREPITGSAVKTADQSLSKKPTQTTQGVENVLRGQEKNTSPAVVDKKENSQSYNGETISLVFDNVDVKNILQLIAEVSNQNIIASDEVKGSVTLRLIDVPWDQALALVLDISGLGMIQEGNVVRVLPKESIRSMRNAELTAATTAEKLEPLETEIVPVNYADLASVSTPATDLLSDRGKITNDQRNKALIITDVPLRIQKIRELVALLDTPERQVMIEARIVEVNSTYSRDLGVNWGLSSKNDRAGSSDRTLDVGVGGSFLIGVPAAGNVGTSPGVGVGMTFGDLLIDNTILSMRISALESAGNAKVISTPRVTTLNGEKALISQGTTIPYQSSGTDGLPKTEFVNAELKLEVTPVINPDGSVILQILATNDSPSLTGGTSNAPQIDTKKAETKVMVMDGHTTVIGGIFVENQSESASGVPWLKDIPILGNLFKSKSKASNRAEVMIFITPRILQGN